MVAATQRRGSFCSTFHSKALTMISNPRVLLIALAAAASGCASGTSAEGPAAARPEPAVRAPAAATAPVVAASPAPAPPSSAGFSDVQANQGRDTFRASCTECHYSSEFSNAQFKFKWSRRSAGNLYQLIQTSMPESAPGSLSPGEAVQLVAYIMRMNGFEPGESDLAPDRAVLDGISLASIREN